VAPRGHDRNRNRDLLLKSSPATVARHPLSARHRRAPVPCHRRTRPRLDRETMQRMGQLRSAWQSASVTIRQRDNRAESGSTGTS